MSADIRPLTDADRPLVRQWTAEDFGDDTVVSRGALHHPDQLPGLIAERHGEPVGLLTYRFDSDSCQVVTIHSRVRRQGIGGALMRAVIDLALQSGINRVWLVTTNDNTPALRFYESREFRVVAVHKGAVDEARRLKPAIPLTGVDGVEIHDELELEIYISP